jgi:hypothetical protein
MLRLVEATNTSLVVHLQCKSPSAMLVSRGVTTEQEQRQNHAGSFFLLRDKRRQGAPLAEPAGAAPLAWCVELLV